MYTRPGPSGDRSARNSTVASGEPTEAFWISLLVVSAGSLLAAEARTTPAAGSHTSLTCHAACTGTNRWFGGHRTFGLSAMVSCGGVVSCAVTGTVQLATFPEASLAVNVTGVMPSGKKPDASAPPADRLFATVTVGLHASLAVATRPTWDPPGDEHSFGDRVGHANSGGVSSTTVTVTCAISLIPSLSTTLSERTWGPSGRVIARRAPVPSERCVACP